MTKILFLCVVLSFSAASGFGAEDDAQGKESRKWAHLKEELPRLPNLAAFLNGSEESAKRFAEAAFESEGSQTQEWKEFDTLLAGGKMDQGGSLIQAELRKLSPEQWYYITRVEFYRRQLVSIGGGILGNMTQTIGNVFTSKQNEIHIKCFEQAKVLLDRTESIKTSGRPSGVFQGWSSKLITANRLRFNEHTASCFRYRTQGGFVEIVADSWDNTLVPARVWWQRDTGMLSGLAAGDGYCGETFEEIDGEKCRKMTERVDTFTNGSKKVYDKAKKILGIWGNSGEQSSAASGYQKTTYSSGQKGYGKVAIQGNRSSKASTISYQAPPPLDSGD